MGLIFLDRTNGKGQVIVIGLIAFCAPGIFNALNALGNAGSSDAAIGALTNSVLYFTFALFGYTGGVFYNFFGPRVLCALGTSTYAVYGLCVYLSGQYSSWGEPLFVLSGALLGVGAGLFWTAQGALNMAYAPNDKKGAYLSLFWVIFNTGAFMGGMISFALNFDNDNASVNAVTYFFFIGVMTMAVVISLTLLNNPKYVIREDNQPVHIEPHKGLSEELNDVAMVITDKNMLLLFVLFFSSNYFYTYVFNSVNGVWFSTRTRGFNSAFFWGAQMVGSVVFARVVDKASGETKDRAKKGFYLVWIVNALAYALGFYVQFGFEGGFTDRAEFKKTLVPIDIIDSSFSRTFPPFLLMLLFGFGDCIIQIFSYWVMSVKAGSDNTLAARYAGYYKGIQSFGGALSWLMDTSYVAMPSHSQLIVNTMLFLVGMAGAWVVIATLEDHDDTYGEEEEVVKTAAVAAEN